MFLNDSKMFSQPRVNYRTVKCKSRAPQTAFYMQHSPEDNKYGVP